MCQFPLSFGKTPLLGLAIIALEAHFLTVPKIVITLEFQCIPLNWLTLYSGGWYPAFLRFFFTKYRKKSLLFIRKKIPLCVFRFLVKATIRVHKALIICQLNDFIFYQTILVSVSLGTLETSVLPTANNPEEE